MRKPGFISAFMILIPGRRSNRIPALYEQGVVPAPLAADASGYFYYINNEGLHRMAPGGAVTEILLDSGSYSFRQMDTLSRI